MTLPLARDNLEKPSSYYYGQSKRLHYREVLQESTRTGFENLFQTPLQILKGEVEQNFLMMFFILYIFCSLFLLCHAIYSVSLSEHAFDSVYIDWVKPLQYRGKSGPEVGVAMDPNVPARNTLTIALVNYQSHSYL